MDGTVTCESRWLHNHSEKSGVSRLVELDFDGFETLSTFEDVVIDDSVSDISGGCIRLRGRVASATLDLSSLSEEARTLRGKGWRPLLDQGGEPIGAIYPDVLPSVRHGQIVSCLEVCREMYWSELERPYELYSQTLGSRH